MGAETVGIGYFILVIIGLVAAVLLFFMPFFVYKIRNQVMEINHKMSRILSVLEQGAGSSGADAESPRILICPKCGTKNRVGDMYCMSCRGPLIPNA